MKQIIVVVFLLISINSYAFDSTPFQANIPGWLEIDLSYGRYYDFYGDGNVVYQKHNIVTKEIKVTYGGTFSYKDYWFEPYFFLGSKLFSTYSNNEPWRNSPFRDNYNFGVGVIFQGMFYFEYQHRCSHQVLSETHQSGNYFDTENMKVYNLYENEPTITYDMFKIGFKIRID